MFKKMSSDKIWKNFPGCECLKSFLINSGYDNIPSLMCINNNEQLENLEKYIEENRWLTEKLSCEHVKSYGTLTKFQFLPGHRAIILNWCQNKLVPNNETLDETSTFKLGDAAFSPILREIIASALSNHQKPPNSHRFSQLLMDFSIYTYIMAGRACYDILCANLPLPKSGTVGKI